MRGIMLGFGLLYFSVGSLQVPAAEPQQPKILVFAAASLTESLQEVAAGYEKTGAATIQLSFNASSVLARQIEAGAHADVFFSADTDWMDYLQTRDLIQPATRQNVLSNRLVLIAPAQSQVSLKIEPHFPLAVALDKGRLATGDPDSVPVGRYARAALTTLGVWDSVADRLARAENVRAAMMYVAHGDAPLGIVYASDALIDKNVRTVDVFPANTHPPILYPVALTKSAQRDASAFVAYITSPQAHKVFLRYGFAELPR